MPTGVYDHPPPSGSGFTYVEIGHGNAAYFLKLTTSLAIKWIAFARRIPIPP